MLWYFTDVTKPGRKCCCSRYLLPMLFLPDALPVLLLSFFIPNQNSCCLHQLAENWAVTPEFGTPEIKKQTDPPWNIATLCSSGSLQNSALANHFSPDLCLLLPFLPSELLSLWVRLSPWLKLSALPGEDLAFLCPHPAVQSSVAAQPPLLQMQGHRAPAHNTALNKICHHFDRLHGRFCKAVQRS